MLLAVIVLLASLNQASCQSVCRPACKSDFSTSFQVVKVPVSGGQSLLDEAGVLRMYAGHGEYTSEAGALIAPIDLLQVRLLHKFLSRDDRCVVGPRRTTRLLSGSQRRLLIGPAEDGDACFGYLRLTVWREQGRRHVDLRISIAAGSGRETEARVPLGTSVVVNWSSLASCATSDTQTYVVIELNGV